MYNREIKFRVWNDKTKKWVHGPHEDSSLDGVNLFGETILLGDFMNVPLKDLNDCIPLQYTGMQDKNGKEIFEGDLLRFKNPDAEKWQIADVRFVSGCFVPDIWITTVDSCEIIGNVFENPDLS